MKTYVIDIDDTLIISEKEICKHCGRMTYKNAIPIKEEIKMLNKLYKYNYIILYTGRGWDAHEITIKQLSKFGIKYHELVMGKPQGVYIDRDAKTTLLEE